VLASVLGLAFWLRILRIELCNFKSHACSIYSQYCEELSSFSSRLEVGLLSYARLTDAKYCDILGFP
jgi:hypothetical protein